MAKLCWIDDRWCSSTDGIVVAKVKQVAPNVSWHHCFIHREALAAKDLSDELHGVLHTAVKMVNFIKASALNTRMFEVLCSEMGSEHVHLLLHAEVRWLSRGKVLNRLFELHQELHQFMVEKSCPLAIHLTYNMWLIKLAYLADVFAHLNELNLTLQGKDTCILQHMDKVNAFVKKLQYWHTRVSAKAFDMFHTVADMLLSTSAEDFYNEEVQKVILNHLDLLTKRFGHYFKDNDNRNRDWILNPFNIIPTDDKLASVPADKIEQLLELSSDRTPQIQHSNGRCNLMEFWLYASTEFPEISHLALQKLFPFSATYLCETGFSAMTAIKTKYRKTFCFK